LQKIHLSENPGRSRHTEIKIRSAFNLGDIEAPTGLDAQTFHPGQLRLIDKVRAVLLQQLGGIGKVGVRRHLLDLFNRRRVHIHGRVNMNRDCLRLLVPLR